MSPGLLVVYALFQLAVGFVSTSVGDLLGLGVVSLAVFAARPESIIAILICEITPRHFNLFGATSDSTHLGSLNYMLSFAIFCRVSYEAWFNPQTFQKARWALGVWYVAIVPAVVMALLGRSEGNASWALPVQTVWMCGALFYGVIVARRWSQDGSFARRWLIPAFTVFLVLTAAGLLLHKVLFIAIPLAFPVIWFTWSRQSTWQRVLSVVLFVLAVFAGGGLGLGMQALEEPVDSQTGEASGLGGTTLTLNGLVVASLALTYLVTRGWAWLRRTASWGVGLPGFAFVVVFSLVVAAIGPRYILNAGSDDENFNLEEKVRAKLFDDRSVIWNAALQDALGPPYVFRPSGRPLWIDHPEWGDTAWKPGAHNAVVNSLMRQRWLSGVALLVLLALVMHRCAKVLSSGVSGEAMALAVYVSVTAIVGVVVNDYPLEPEAAFWFFVFAGMVVAASWGGTGPSVAGETVKVSSYGRPIARHDRYRSRRE